jgi:nicotinate phosphoribosyltransferase
MIQDTYIPITRTDGYKLSMAEAGAPLRIETFYYTHRRGGINGWHYMPVDVDQFVRSLLPTPKPEDYNYLTHHNYEVGAAYRRAMTLRDSLVVRGVPKGCWFYNREPAYSVKATSVISSWLEPTGLMLQFRIQAATAIITDTYRDCRYATCSREKEILIELYESLGVQAPEITVRSEDYFKTVLKRGQDIVTLLGDPSRAFEVGMRAVSCIEQHEIALAALKEAGIVRTSNVEAAQKLDMIPVGTMGHEHLQRMDGDYEGFTSMRDRFPGFLSYLLDTFDTLRSGVPTGLRVIAEQPYRQAGLRFDSEKSVLGQYVFAVARSRDMGLEPYFTLESGWNYEKTVEFEKYREMLGWPSKLQGYGYGGYFVKPEWPTFERDDVAAVYKLSQTGSKACMKFGDDPGSPKQSIPGEPVIWRPKPLSDRGNLISIIAQAGEDIMFQDDFYRVDLEGSNYLPPMKTGQKSSINSEVRMSPQTVSLIAECTAHRESIINEASRTS